jgi:hypothetical protein
MRFDRREELAVKASSFLIDRALRTFPDLSIVVLVARVMLEGDIEVSSQVSQTVQGYKFHNREGYQRSQRVYGFVKEYRIAAG